MKSYILLCFVLLSQAAIASNTLVVPSGKYTVLEFQAGRDQIIEVVDTRYSDGTNRLRALRAENFHCRMVIAYNFRCKKFEDGTLSEDEISTLKNKFGKNYLRFDEVRLYRLIHEAPVLVEHEVLQDGIFLIDNVPAAFTEYINSANATYQKLVFDNHEFIYDSQEDEILYQTEIKTFNNAQTRIKTISVVFTAQ